MPQEIDPKHKAGFVSILGRPNVGKSTLTNALMGEHICITTPKAQTTRHRIHAILNADDYQIIISDTPGILTPKYALQKSMMTAVESTYEDTDMFLFVVEVGKEISTEEQKTLDKILRVSEVPLVILLNKIDTTDSPAVERWFGYWKELYPRAEVLPLCATEAFGVDVLTQMIVEMLPPSPAYYPKDILTNKSERFVASEMIRQQILHLYQKEIPYAVEIVISSFTENDERIDIAAEIYVERESQKAILLGHRGQNLSKLGKKSRYALKRFFAKPIYLHLRVKVLKKWRTSSHLLKRFGYEN